MTARLSISCVEKRMAECPPENGTLSSPSRLLFRPIKGGDVHQSPSPNTRWNLLRPILVRSNVLMLMLRATSPKTLSSNRYTKCRVNLENYWKTGSAVNI